MQNNKTLKGLLAVSAVAAMFSSFGVHAQSSTTAAGQSMGQTGTGTGSQATPNTSGKTTSAGAMGNSNSTGMESRPEAGSSSMGQSGAAGATGSSASLSSGDKKAIMDMAQADINEVAAYYRDYGSAGIQVSVAPNPAPTSGQAGGELFNRLDANKDGKVSLEELEAFMRD